MISPLNLLCVIENNGHAQEQQTEEEDLELFPPGLDQQKANLLAVLDYVVVV